MGCFCFPFKLKITLKPLGNVYSYILDYLLNWVDDYHWENCPNFLAHWNVTFWQIITWRELSNRYNALEFTDYIHS